MARNSGQDDPGFQIIGDNLSFSSIATTSSAPPRTKRTTKTDLPVAITNTQSRGMQAEEDVIIYDPEVSKKLENLDTEILSVSQQLRQLKTLHASLTKERNQVFQSYLQSIEADGDDISAAQVTVTKRKLGTDYTQSDYSWSSQVKQAALQVFEIPSFRMCQEAVLNAAMDNRDAVVVMPTGGGKSLCYQLPAVVHPGTTLVVSPLISLMTDQVFHLREMGVDCELLFSGNSREQTSDILKRLKAPISPSISSSSADRFVQKDGIKLLYVTPERVASSKTLLSALQKAYEQGRLSRIVIDEAHCCSQMGHDFRPDYKKLSILRKLFPNVPIMCLTATCGPQVLREILQIISLAPTTEPENAAPRRTVYFTAPLFRPNLRYRVVTRPQNAQAAAGWISEYILQNHRDQCGIVYCLSRKDTHSMAEALYKVSSGKIRTGIYHADLDDSDKTNVHTDWRTGKIKVVCATIAFGMGIDKANVRFVFHACMSKSLDGYYQETGRAGRDGNPSDCVLLYRPQDESRISSLVAGEPTGTDKLHAMLKYAQSFRCRQLVLSEYFSDATLHHDNKNSNSTSMLTEKGCQVCDNCLTNPQPIDVSYPAWQMTRIVQYIAQASGRITLSALCDVARGLNGGKFNINAKATSHIDLVQVANGKVDLTRDNCERLVIQLLLDRYLCDEYNATGYTVNVYVGLGPNSIRFTRISSPSSFPSSTFEQSITLPSVQIVAASSSQPLPTRKRKLKPNNNIDDQDLSPPSSPHSKRALAQR